MPIDPTTGRADQAARGEAKHAASASGGFVMKSAVDNRLLDDRALARRLGETARSQVLLDHSWDGSAKECEVVYANVLGRNGESTATAPLAAASRFRRTL